MKYLRLSKEIKSTELLEHVSISFTGIIFSTKLFRNQNNKEEDGDEIS